MISEVEKISVFSLQMGDRVLVCQLKVSVLGLARKMSIKVIVRLAAIVYSSLRPAAWTTLDHKKIRTSSKAL